MMVPDLSVPQRIHVMAAGGAAMSAVCHILATMGHAVSGCDQGDSVALDRLRADGLDMAVGHDIAHLSGIDLLAVSTAVKVGNTEYDAAAQAGIPIARRPDLMQSIAVGQRTLAVSGTHGKTTTSAMAALAGVAAGWDPSFIVGGVVNQLGSGVRWTGSGRLVVEADESDNSFLRFGADDVIVTNIEPDHLDFHGSMEQLEAEFDRFVIQGSGVKVVCLDDPGVRRLVQRVGATAGDMWTYGTDDGADYRIIELRTVGLRSRFAVELRGEVIARLDLKVPGAHNARNATAVVAAFHALGADLGVVVESLTSFTGVGRRFEYRGEARGVTFVDDYAHLPTEVSAMVTAAAGGGWARVVAVFEPHRYTRIRDIGADFADSFTGADVVVITALYAAGQAPIEGIDSLVVSSAVRAAHPTLAVIDAPTREELVAVLTQLLQPGDLCLSMNAGELTTLPSQMLAGEWAGGGVA